MRAGLAALGFALLASATAAVAASPKPTPDSVAAAIQRDGAKRVVNRLFDGDGWNVVMAGMERGDVRWIALAPQLAAGSDAGASEELGIVLAAALTTNPSAVLRVIGPPGDPVLGVDRVCGLPFIEPTPRELRRYETQSLKAVGAVTDPKLAEVRRACLRELRRSEGA